MKRQNEYLICLIPSDSPQYHYWGGHGFHYLGVANRYKTAKSASAVLKAILDPNTIAHEKLPANWQERGYKLEVRHESAALSSDAVLGGNARKPQPGDAVLGNQSKIDKAVSLCQKYSELAASLAKKLHDQSWMLTSKELSSLASTLQRHPNLAREVEEAFELRFKELPIMERTPEWQMFRAIERGLGDRT